jgi:AcrR family transcriptional regulator
MTALSESRKPAKPRAGRRQRGKRAGDTRTREHLMREAMELLAREGFNNVSLRRIVRATGGANPSAVRYHFGDRLNLIREIATMLREWFEPRALARLAALRERGAYTPRDVIIATFGPVIEMAEAPALGTNAVRFLARLGWDFGHEGQKISADFHAPSLQLALALLQPALPDVDEDVLKFKLVVMMNNVYNGLAYRGYMWRSPFGPLALARTEHGGRLTRAFLDYLEGGLRG